MGIEIKVVGSSGQPTGQKLIARDADHAARIERRVKVQAGVGNSITFQRKSI